MNWANALATSGTLLAFGAWRVFWAPRLMTRYQQILMDAGQWQSVRQDLLTARELRLSGLLWLALGLWPLAAR